MAVVSCHLIQFMECHISKEFLLAQPMSTNKGLSFLQEIAQNGRINYIVRFVASQSSAMPQLILQSEFCLVASP